MRKSSKPEKKIQDSNDEELNPEEIKECNDVELEKIKKTDNFENLYNLSTVLCNCLLRTTTFLVKVSGFYLLWICLHYFSAHLYVKFCVPNTVVGFIMSPFMISTPHCQGLRWIVYNAANVINHMWIIIGTWIYSLIWIVNGENTPNISSG